MIPPKAGLTSALMARHGFTASDRALEARRGLMQTYSTKCAWSEIADALGLSLDTVLAEATRLQDEDMYRDAAELLAHAAASDGAGTVLLERLAWVEQMQDHDTLALALLEVARADSPAHAECWSRASAAV